MSVLIDDLLFWNTARLKTLYETEDVPAYASAVRAEDFSGLPSTYTFVGDQDIFHDETLQYVNKLRDAGVEVGYDEYPGCYHGFEVAVPDAEISGQALTNLMEAYRYDADNYFAPQN